MKNKKVIILGATGSIGSSTLKIINQFRDNFIITGITAHTNQEKLNAIASEYNVKKTCLTSLCENQNLVDFIQDTDADIVVNGISGANGMLPSFAAIESGKDLALANKETIVMAGSLLQELAQKKDRKILPVDSEHSAIFTLINSFNKKNISEVVLTASGGPFRTWSKDKIAQATKNDALKHPTWSMGSKITIDSASLANKGLEIIEANILFNIKPQHIKVVVHPQSIIHSLIKTCDGIFYAQISPPDMCHPILTALFWPEIQKSNLKELDFSQAFSMDFEPPRYQDFPMLNLAYKTIELEGKYSIAYNAANEQAVYAFLQDKIRFNDISKITAELLNLDWSTKAKTVEEVIETDKKARFISNKYIEGLKQ